MKPKSKQKTRKAKTKDVDRSASSDSLKRLVSPQSLDYKIRDIIEAHANAAFLEWHHATEGETILGLDIQQGKAARKQGWDAAIEYALKRGLLRANESNSPTPSQ